MIERDGDRVWNNIFTITSMEANISLVLQVLGAEHTCGSILIVFYKQ